MSNNPAEIIRELLKDKVFRTALARYLGHPDPENVEVDWKSLKVWEDYLNEPVMFYPERKHDEVSDNL